MPTPRRRVTKEYVFDPRLGGSGRYVEKSTGRIVSETVVNSALDIQIDRTKDKMMSLSRDLANGNISIAEWQSSMRDNMRIIHTHSAALAKGGWVQMSPSDWGAVGRITRDDYANLEKFAVKIETGEVKLFNLAGEVNGNFLRATQSFADAGNGTWWAMQDREAERNGVDVEIRILDTGAQHCDCCPAQAGHWEPIGTLLAIGDCTCGDKCRCTKKYGQRLEDGTIKEL